MTQGPSSPPTTRNPAERTNRRTAGFVKRTRLGPGSYDRRMSPAERRDEQRRTLVDAAAHVFARDGYANGSVASILEVSGLSRGTFYRHFRDLREAFLAVQESGAELLFERIDTANRAHSAPQDKMRASITAYLQVCADFGDLSRVFHREAITNGKEYATLRKRNLERLHALFREGLALALAQGHVRRMPDDLTIYAIIVAIEGVALRYLEEHREQEILEAVDPLLRLAQHAFF